MHVPTYTRLDRSVLSITGEDRRTFLQGLISNDINKATGDQAIWAALLSPQGKFQWEMFIVEHGEALLIDTESQRFADFCKKLSLYRLRSKVTLSERPDLSVFAFGAEGHFGLPDSLGAARRVGEGIIYTDPRISNLGGRALLPSTESLTAVGFTPEPFSAWDDRRIALGIPDGSRDLPVDKALLLENGFEELGGVDFAKGCYMGQELTARTKYRGLVRKRLLPVTFPDGASPSSGALVFAGDTEAGEMRSVGTCAGLALLRLEHLAAPLTSEGQPLTPVVPGWIKLPGGDISP